MVDGQVVYTPDANFSGQDSFTYTVSDGTTTATATVQVTVSAVNDRPEVDDFSVTTEEDQSVSIDVLASAKDVDGDPLTIKSVGTPSNGTARIVNGRVVYTPAANFVGSDRFTYTITDGLLTDNGTISVSVTATNDDPQVKDDRVSTAEDTPITIDVMTNDWDLDNDRLTLVSLGTPAYGQAEIQGDKVVYTPASNFVGEDRFTYTVTDGTQPVTGTIIVTVSPVNDRPEARDDVRTTPWNTVLAIDVLANDRDVDGDPLTVESFGTPDHGSVELIDGQIVYTPQPNFVGEDRFSYTITDGNLTSEATVIVNVSQGNRAPQAVPDRATTPINTPVTIDVLNNDQDPDGDSLRVTEWGSPEHGKVERVDGQLVYTPEPGFVGNDSFTYVVSDGLLSAVGTVSVGIEGPTNQNGVLGETGSVTVDQANADTWHRVDFGNRYQDPVVVMGPASFNGGQATTVRIRAVDQTGFEFQLDEWDYLDGYHMTETLSWMVMERGVHTLEDGTKVVAGVSDARSRWDRIDLQEGGFGSSPLVFTQVGSVNEASAVTTRIRNLSGSGFDVKLQEEEANGSHGFETIYYIAMQPGNNANARFTGDVITHRTNTVVGSVSGMNNPVILAQMVTTDGGNTATLRYQIDNQGQVRLHAHEEQSSDSEVWHTTENVALLIWEAGEFRAAPDQPASGPSAWDGFGRSVELPNLFSTMTVAASGYVSAETTSEVKATIVETFEGFLSRSEDVDLFSIAEWSTQFDPNLGVLKNLIRELDPWLSQHQTTAADRPIRDALAASDVSGPGDWYAQQEAEDSEDVDLFSESFTSI